MYAGSLLVLFVMLIVQVFMVLRMIPGFRPSFIKALPERNEIYHFGFWSWLQTVISLIAYQMDRFIIAWFLGTATVTYYVLASTITNHLHMAFVAAVSWLLPKISRLKAALNDTKKHFYTIRTFSIGFSLLIIATLYFVSEPLFTLWLGHEKYLKFVGFFRLFLIFEAFLVLSIVPNQYLNAIKSLSFSTALEFIFKSGIVVFMILFFSIAGTAESLIWGQITALVLFMPLEYYLVNDRILKGNAFKETVLAMLPSFFISAAILWTNWIGTAVLFSLGCLSYYLVYFRDEHFERRLLTE
jgi:O-antigen/teichoic acid export membrane protein